MKIESITVKNFKGCPDGTYNLSKLNMLIGKNGKGKTSFQLALRYLLNGKLPADPIRHGNEILYVSGIIEGNVEIARKYYLPDTFRVNQNEVTEKAFTKKVVELKGNSANKPLLSVLVPSNKFFTAEDQDSLWEFLETGGVSGVKIMGIKELSVELADGTSLYMRKTKPSECLVAGKKVTAKKFNELLADHMYGNQTALDITTSSEIIAAMDMADFAKYLMSIIPVKMDFSKLSKLAELTPEETEALAGLFPEAPTPILLENVASAYKAVFGIRHDLRLEMDEWKKRSMFDGFLPLPDVKHTQFLLAEANKKIGAAMEIEKAWGIYKQRVSERQRSINTLKEWIDTYNKMDKSPVPKAGQLEYLQNMENTLRQNIEMLVRNIAASNETYKSFQRMMENLNNTVCPLCNKLVCHTDKTVVQEDIATAMQDLQNNMQRLAGEKNNVENQLKQVLEQKEAVRGLIEKYNQKVQLYRRIQELNKSIPKEPVEPAPVPDVTMIKRQAQRYQLYIQQSAVLEKCKEAYQKFEEVKAQYELYCSLVKKTEPRKGILTCTILNYLLQPFHEHVNGFISSVFPDTEIAFQMGDNGLEVVCCPHNHTSYIPIRSLSDGERMLALFTLMEMISSISGTRILVFDRLESMDTESIHNLLNTLQSKEVQERYDHILLASVDHADICGMLKEMPGVNMISML